MYYMKLASSVSCSWMHALNLFLFEVSKSHLLSSSGALACLRGSLTFSAASSLAKVQSSFEPSLIHRICPFEWYKTNWETRRPSPLASSMMFVQECFSILPLMCPDVTWIYNYNLKGIYLPFFGPTESIAWIICMSSRVGHCCSLPEDPSRFWRAS